MVSDTEMYLVSERGTKEAGARTPDRQGLDPGPIKLSPISQSRPLAHDRMLLWQCLPSKKKIHFIKVSKDIFSPLALKVHGTMHSLDL